MELAGHNFKFDSTLDSSITVPDSFVTSASKIGRGHGEKKLYIASREIMYKFFGKSGFSVKCFLLKSDLISYMNALHAEYLHPTQSYKAVDRMTELWKLRLNKINSFPEIIEFNIISKDDLNGDRGYVNSDDAGYELIRQISLPLFSYISIMKLKDSKGSTIFYWKLFADFEAISDKKEALVYTYGKKNNKKNIVVKPPKESDYQKEIRKAREGQGIYRAKLLDECPFCPFTKISDERLLIASHIKPWAIATDEERVDPKNGFILSPLYDKLFDRGLMSFTNERKVILSNWISPANKDRLRIKHGQFIQSLPMDEERKAYLEFHRNFVFKG